MSEAIQERGPRRPTSRLDFEIAIICALAIEANAVYSLFDHSWDEGGPLYDKATGDTNAYSAGTIGRHNVVLAHMPGMGKANAAAVAVAVSCRASFPNIKLPVLETQIALAYTYWLRRTSPEVPTFWVHGSNAEQFQQTKDHGRWLMVIDNADDMQLFFGSPADSSKGDDHLPLALVQAAAFIEANTITVGEYLRLLDKGDRRLVDLLGEEFETVGRDLETPRAVAETWILSFEQI
ncbi:hypothetical protein B0T26DRAFT_800118 [Lasiosphaeria miniovina]|uniref:Uncharacterized protein n=1 Tax=Lasiosphaeria miniovina TaxID=1954250 RepID=A0AA40B614_9PEZI|nr:uncharacterized protein B0T26DRAFT_800118 [Lasiosphaeria miniovina]KAK0728340.1 hypothetical protein B0T26DRAFT_800118 [Lasiosphaeria miniovina]